jgi:phosphoglycolate phosphatase
MSIHTVLFDLDGTLLDTAPDLAAALNYVLEANAKTALDFETIRPHVSHGAAALIKLGFDIDPADPEFDNLRQQLLQYYHNNLAEHTRPFEGILELLHNIEQQGMNWGIVTNKPSWLTTPLLDALQLSDRPSCVVCGDTLDERKPHPAPMFHACELSGSKASECIYIGDAKRDIEAGNNAGMHTIIALFGYIGDDQAPEAWGADAALADIPSIMDYINCLNSTT